MNSRPTQLAFLLGALYFCCMSGAHFFGVKIPGLFVYYDTPYLAYQDKIISFAVCAYVALFYNAAKHRDVALSAIAVLALTVAGLSAVNLSSALQEVLKEGLSTVPYWLQTGMIAGILAVLVGLYLKDGRSQTMPDPSDESDIV